jgi:hypothetical protein
MSNAEGKEPSAISQSVSEAQQCFSRTIEPLPAWWTNKGVRTLKLPS